MGEAGHHIVSMVCLSGAGSKMSNYPKLDAGHFTALAIMLATLGLIDYSCNALFGRKELALDSSPSQNLATNMTRVYLDSVNGAIFLMWKNLRKAG